MYSNSVKRILEVNKGNNFLIVGHKALADNGLIYGTNAFTMYTPFPELHLVRLGNVHLTHYHFHDNAYLKLIDEENHVYMPSRERVLIDGIAWLDESYNEGELIEGLQNYIHLSHNDFTKLYEVADHYGVERSKVDYWLNEAREESDMSMG